MFDLDLPPEISPSQMQKMQQTYESQNERNYPIKQTNSTLAPNMAGQASGSPNLKKQGFFDKLFNKKNKQKAKFDEDINSGYKGTLPDINKEFNYKTQKAKSIKKETNNAEEYTPEEFQNSKIDDPLFLDTILNKTGTSKYVQDMLKVMRFLESFRIIVQNHDDVQKFNANVNLLDLYTKRIQKLYDNAPEASDEAYYLLLNLSYKAKVLGNLKFDSNYYSKFSPVAGTQYDPSNIYEEDNKFLIDLDKTIFAIRQLNN